MAENKIRIGFIGLGAMGLPIARWLVRNVSCELLVFDGRPQLNAAAGAWGGVAFGAAAPCTGLDIPRSTSLITTLRVEVNVAATAEAVALAEKAGLPATALVPLILKGSGSSYALANHIAHSALHDDLGEGKFGVDY